MFVVVQKDGDLRRSPAVQIRSVWAENVYSEFRTMEEQINLHPFIAMDTEFPGVVFRSIVDNFHLSPRERYLVVKANVDAMKLIQVGFTLSDADGNLPDLGTNGSSRFVWEFNFRDFDPRHDIHAPTSIQLLKNNGIDFEENGRRGIDLAVFAQLMLRSRLLGNSSIQWVTFHGMYDFAYLIKILTVAPLPMRLEGFLWVLKAHFGNWIYDMKHMIRYCGCLHGGLEKVAQALHVERAAGKCHQAGSDSLMTLQVFVGMRNMFFKNNDYWRHAGVLFGLEPPPPLVVVTSFVPTTMVLCR